MYLCVVKIFGDCYGQRLPESSLFENGLSIDHKNFDKNDNSIFNLEIVSHRENVIRSVNHYKLAKATINIGDIF